MYTTELLKAWKLVADNRALARIGRTEPIVGTVSHYESMLSSVQKLSKASAVVWVEPMVPGSQYRDFCVEKPTDDNAVLSRSGSGARVELPLLRIEEIIPGTSAAKPMLLLKGRIQ